MSGRGRAVLSGARRAKGRPAWIFAKIDLGTELGDGWFWYATENAALARAAAHMRDMMTWIRSEPTIQIGLDHIEAMIAAGEVRRALETFQDEVEHGLELEEWTEVVALPAGDGSSGVLVPGEPIWIFSNGWPSKDASPWSGDTWYEGELSALERVAAVMAREISMLDATTLGDDVLDALAEMAVTVAAAHTSVDAAGKRDLLRSALETYRTYVEPEVNEAHAAAARLAGEEPYDRNLDVFSVAPGH